MVAACVICREAPRRAKSKTCSKECGTVLRKAQREQWRADNPDYPRLCIARKHGLTLEQLDALGSECNACGFVGPLVVDHDHNCCPGKRSCGRCVRGVLCNPCNLALGLLGDDLGRVMGLARYITQEESSCLVITPQECQIQ